MSGTSKNAEGPSFCVIVPMYNEAEGAETAIDRISTAIEPFAHRAGFIVVNDGSTDGTREAIERSTKQRPSVIFVDRQQNGGYGAALRSGVEEAARRGFEYALFMDSDLTNDPDDIEKFAEKMTQGYDVIKASRFEKGGGMRGVPFRRSIFSHVGNIVARAITGTGLRDCTNGFRAVRINLLVAMTLHERGFAVIMEELYRCKLAGATFAEVPSVLTSRSDAARPTAFAYSFATFYRYLKYCLLCLGRIG